MFNTNPFFKSQNHHVCIFIGSLNEKELEEYLEELGVDDNEPINNFSKDLGTWYDHDYIWCEAVDTPIDIKELCEFNGIDDTTLIKKLEKQCTKKISSIIFLWNAEALNTEDKRVFSDGKLEFLSHFEYESPIIDQEEY